MIASDKPMFCTMIRRARREWASTWGRWRRSSPISATSAVSMATSVPIAPIAMPMSAVASAGASLTPLRPSRSAGRRRGGQQARLVLGQQVGVHGGDAGVGGHAWAVRALSPVSMAAAIPFSSAVGLTSGASGRSSSRTAIAATTTASRSSRTTVAQADRRRGDVVGQSFGCDPARLAQADRGVSDAATDAVAGRVRSRRRPPRRRVRRRR